MKFIIPTDGETKKIEWILFFFFLTLFFFFVSFYYSPYLLNNMTGFGRSLRTEFMLEDGYTPLNHGSYGVYPKAVRPYLHDYQLQAEINPDKFLRREMFPVLESNRERLASLVHCDPQELAFVTNASVGINSVIRSLMLHHSEKLLCVSFGGK